jgi:hypothetical protein
VARRNDDLDALLERIGRRNAGLTVDDIVAAVGDALKTQRKDILSHVGRMFRLQEVKAAPAQSQWDERFKNLHRRLVVIESEIRSLKKGGSR